MLEGKDLLVIGARSGGYGAAIASAALEAGARVFGVSLNPFDESEKTFFADLGAILLDTPLRFDADRRDNVSDALGLVRRRLKDHGVSRLHAVIHAVAGGFPRQPSVMKAVGDIMRGRASFNDMATAVKRNVYYVNAGSFHDTIEGLAELSDENTHFAALTYRGDLPYFISDTKRWLERLAVRAARSGRRTLAAAFPEAWTQSSQFFVGIEVAVLGHYMEYLRGKTCAADLSEGAFLRMNTELEGLEGFDNLLDDLARFMDRTWRGLTQASDQGAITEAVKDLFFRLRKEGRFSVLRRSVEIISDFVREAASKRFINDFIVNGDYRPGDVRRITYHDLISVGVVGAPPPRAPKPSIRSKKRNWLVFEKDEVRKTLSMYGDNFLFVDRVVMEAGEMYDGAIGFGRFTAPTPDENPIMRDHFVGMPLFGGHLQMEAAAQFGTFMLLKCIGDPRLIPILTGTEFPDLNTMAPPGEKLTMMGVIRMPEKRLLTLEVSIENRYARSKGVIRGMILGERIVRKMLSSFHQGNLSD
jgi:3-hydroxymyristoyl/3-hydroxydecanoyl-(acyl carrier protein) dehydratase/NAD(P)-dependent dehydrogenase (short-subunit alcohol dehydrogenase family)